jgi:chromosome segregation ATPase
MNNTPKTDVIKRIQDYLLSGGMWNPELAIHDNVRDLIIDCRTEIENLQSERNELRKKCAEWIYSFRDLRTLTQQLDEEINDLLDEQDSAKNAFLEILKTNEDTSVLIYQKMEDIARKALDKIK